MSIVFVNMPIVDLQRPNLGLSLLQSILGEAGMDCRVLYANLLYAEKIGVAKYEHLGNGTRSWFTLLLGEAAFRRAAFPDLPFEEEQILELAARGPVSDVFRRSFRELQRLSTEMVYELAADIVAQRPALVGCTSTFQQHLPSLALLRQVRELDPNIITMLGGANCETLMGVATHRNFPWVDVVVSGEADGIIAPLCRELLDQGLEGAKTRPGVYLPRHRQEGYASQSRASFHELNTLPYPRFDDFFEALQASPLQPAIQVGLPLETSRGCWWGAKHHCTFCGLNGGGMAFRKKSPERALAEMEWLADRWGVTDLEVVDNILDLRYFETVIPALAASPRDWNIFYEVKSNLRPAQLKALAEAGIRSLQPGIESLDSRVLQLMDKGARGWQQVQFLKYAHEYGIGVSWNLLLDFPGDEEQWYVETAELMPLLFHLQPPSGLTPIRFDRYSPYFENAEQYGLKLLAHPMMQYLYPVDADQAFDLGYHFQKEGGMVFQRKIYYRLQEIIQEWIAAYLAGCRLTVEDGPDGLRFHDTRPCAGPAEILLQGVDRDTYLACAEAVPVRNLPADSVARLVSQKLAVVLDDRCLGLAHSTSAAGGPVRVRFPGGSVDPSRLSPKARAGRGGLFEEIFR